jgi:hypothetical protein
MEEKRVTLIATETIVAIIYANQLVEPMIYATKELGVMSREISGVMIIVKPLFAILIMSVRGLKFHQIVHLQGTFTSATIPGEVALVYGSGVV